MRESQSSKYSRSISLIRGESPHIEDGSQDNFPQIPHREPVVNSSSTEAPCLGAFKLCHVDFIINYHHTHAPCYWMNAWRWEVTEDKSLLDPVSSCLQPSYQPHLNSLMFVGKQEHIHAQSDSECRGLTGLYICINRIFILAVNQKYTGKRFAFGERSWSTGFQGTRVKDSVPNAEVKNGEGVGTQRFKDGNQKITSVRRGED